MRRHALIMAMLLAPLAGCTEQAGGNNTAANVAAANESVAAPSAAPARPTGEAGMRQLAECAATFEAVANLWDAIASQSTGSEADEARNTATMRRGAAAGAEIDAGAIAMGLGRSPDEVPRIKRERSAALERERAGREFADFATWLGREADQCAALDPSFR